MKINEILLEDSNEKKPHVYLDMDGVQADFFGAWSEYHNVPHWKAIQNREKEIEQLANSSEQEVYDFFRDLKPLKGGKQVVGWLKQNNIDFTVLSAPLKGPFREASVRAKKDWLDEHNPGTSSSAIFTGNKQNFAVTNGTPNVLIDDFGVYLRNWASAGGIAVKHEDEYEMPNSGIETIKQLKKIFLKDTSSPETREHFNMLKNNETAYDK